MSSFTLNRSGLHELMTSPAGPIAQDLFRRGERVRTEAERLSAGPGRGRVYKRRGVIHQAAAPGDPFASDTGHTRATITVEMGVDGIGLYARVGSNDQVLADQEFGTSRMPAHPVLRPALPAASDYVRGAA